MFLFTRTTLSKVPKTKKRVTVNPRNQLLKNVPVEIAKAGFKYVETPFPYEATPDDLARVLEEHGLQQVKIIFRVLLNPHTQKKYSNFHSS